MMKWEYEALSLTRNVENQWLGIDANTEPIVGIGNFLESWGANRWELVNMVADYGITDKNGVYEVKGYQVVFKRQLLD